MMHNLYLVNYTVSEFFSICSWIRFCCGLNNHFIGQKKKGKFVRTEIQTKDRDNEDKRAIT